MDHTLLVPGNSLSFEGGFFGLSAVVLIRAEGAAPILFDCGHHVTKGLLLDALSAQRLAPQDIGTLVLSHLHFDHATNIDLFPEARIIVSQAELDYAQRPDPRDLYVATDIVSRLARRDVTAVSDDGDVLAGLRHIATPGHTPGHIALRYSAPDGARVTLAADAVKTAREAMSGTPDLEFDALRRGGETIRALVAESDIIVPGHHPELRRTAAGWTWSEPSRLTLVIR
jgi:glyoxylase-like metal-dependent hydrolase (beta-lactamase superfamily II)